MKKSQDRKLFRTCVHFSAITLIRVTFCHDILEPLKLKKSFQAISRKQEAYVDTRDVVQRDHLREQSFFGGGGEGGGQLVLRGNGRELTVNEGGRRGICILQNFIVTQPKFSQPPPPSDKSCPVPKLKMITPY